MKQCVKCRQLFADKNLRFCRFDGSPLVDEITPAQEATTILFTTEELNSRFPLVEELRRQHGSGKLYE